VTFQARDGWRNYLAAEGLGDSWRPTFTAAASLAGGSLPVRPDHGDLILTGRTDPFATGVAIHGCTAGGDGWMKGVEARTPGILFGAVSVALALAPEG
jgi:hypothetical protein